MPPGWLFPLLLLISVTTAHIRLTFPPSFSYSDAIINDDKAICATSPTEGSPSTYLQSGSTIDIEWTTSVPHSGGIKIEVLDSSNKPVSIFTDFGAPHNISSSTHRLVIPKSFTCQECTLRLSQGANEIASDRVYISCASVNIGKNIPDGDTCNGKGKRVNGVCLCKEPHVGSHCQHYFECDNDADCGRGGNCHITSPASRVCFCAPGKKGVRCEQNYPSEVVAFDETLYKVKKAGNNKIYWRIINDEIEFVLKYPGRSWAAIGWKPIKDNGQCSATLDKIRQMAIATDDSELLLPVPASTRRTPVSTTTTRSVTSSQCGENEDWSECPEEKRDCEASCDWTLDPDTIPNCTRDCGIPRCVCKEGFVRASANSTRCIPFDACNPTDHTCGSNETWAQCGTACEPSCANMYDTSPCPASCEKAACTCADNYVRHDGKCIYWGDCPDLDEHFAFSDDNGVNDISNRTSTETVTSSSVAVHPPITSCPVNETINDCGKACETDCVSIFVREQCSKCGPTDCSCIQGYARSNGRCVYWGDCPSEEISLQPVNNRFPTKPRVIGSECKGEFAVPAGCTTNCDYRVMWNYMDDTDEVEFAIETKIGSNSWTGVGFSDTPTMENADMYVVKSVNNQVTVHDMWSTGQGTPVEDRSRDIAVPNPMGSHVDGVLRARFKRRRESRDKSNDIDFSDSHCVYMLFPVDGGSIDDDGAISVPSTPLTSERKVCFKTCKALQPVAHAKAESNSCINEFRYPANCLGETCEYIAKWNYNSTNQDVRFEISARDLGRWTGIGFSKNGEMTNADIYTGWVYEGKAYVIDRFAYGRQLPAIDPADRHDITDIGGKIEDDVQTIWFTRSVVTKDTLTDLPLDKCYFYLFPVGGGRVLARKSSDFHNPRTPIGYHDIESPHVSTTKICICDENESPIPTQPPAVRRRRQTPFNVPKNPFGGEAEDITTNGGVHTDPMACADMVMGTTSGKSGRVVDMFSVGTSTPLEDGHLGGSDSLRAASAVYDDGITTITFRKKLIATEPTDISISRGPMQVLWAQGVDPSSYRHITGGAPIKADPTFFASDSFKYHGMDNRGLITIDFYAEGDREEASGAANDCRGSMSFPHGCNGDLCRYHVSWESDGQTASFSLQADIKTLQWTAIGFSPNGAMAHSDVVVVSVLEDGKVTVIDQFMPSYGRPTIDKNQDIFDISTKFTNGRVYANFSRDLKDIDGEDVSLDECRYFLYTPVSSSLDKGGEINKHSISPTASAGKICLNSCSTLPATSKPTTESTISIEELEEIEVEEAPVKTTTARVVSTSSKPVKTVSTTPTTVVPSVKTIKTTTELPPTVKTHATTKMAVPPLHNGPVRPIPKARYALKIRVVNREFVPDLSNEKSEYYQSFTKDLKTAVDKMLAVRWKDVEMGRVLSYSKGSVIAFVEIDSMSTEPRPIEIKSVIEETAIRGVVNGFAIEPTTVTIQQIPVEQQKTGDREVEEVLMNATLLKSIGMVAGAVVICLLTVICACVLICRCRRVTHQFSPMGSTNGKSYSDIPYKADTYPAYPNPANPYGTLNIKKTSTTTSAAGFDNKAYQHQRHFSQATTASTKQTPPPSNDPSPAGIGETTYQEWLNKVANKPASQQHEEAPRPPSATPYVSYPNDPSAYYTLGGEHRSGSRNYRQPY